MYDYNTLIELANSGEEGCIQALQRIEFRCRQLERDKSLKMEIREIFSEFLGYILGEANAIKNKFDDYLEASPHESWCALTKNRIETFAKLYKAFIKE